MNEIKEILISEEQILKRVKELGESISKDYDGKEPILICVLKGSIIFMSDLMRAISVPHLIDFIAVSSYEKTESSGIVRLLKDLSIDVFDRDIIIIEDIVDTGLTLSYLIKNFKLHMPSSIKVCVLLDKRCKRKIDVPVDYIGFEIPDKFVVGYGLDYEELYRNLPYIGVL